EKAREARLLAHLGQPAAGYEQQLSIREGTAATGERGDQSRGGSARRPDRRAAGRGQTAGFDADHDCLIKRAARGLDGVPSRFGAIGDMRTNAQPASRNERITWTTSPSCRTAMGKPQRRKTFSMGRLRESTSASSRSR